MAKKKPTKAQLDELIEKFAKVAPNRREAAEMIKALNAGGVLREDPKVLREEPKVLREEPDVKIIEEEEEEEDPLMDFKGNMPGDKGYVGPGDRYGYIDALDYMMLKRFFGKPE